MSTGYSPMPLKHGGDLREQGKKSTPSAVIDNWFNLTSPCELIEENQLPELQKEARLREKEGWFSWGGGGGAIEMSARKKDGWSFLWCLFLHYNTAYRTSCHICYSWINVWKMINDKICIENTKEKSQNVITDQISYSKNLLQCKSTGLEMNNSRSI